MMHNFKRLLTHKNSSRQHFLLQSIKMKFSPSVLCAMTAAAIMPASSAFTVGGHGMQTTNSRSITTFFTPPSKSQSRMNKLQTQLQATATKEGAAVSKEEDIALTLAIIMAHGKQDLSDASSEAVPLKSAEDLAYIAADFKSMDYNDFIDKYLSEAVEDEPVVTETEVRSLFSVWNDALATGDSAKVASLYSKNPVLLPTVSDVPRTDFDSVKDYFDAFLLKEPQGEILEGHITIGDGWANDSGIYEFTMGTTGDKVKARYTYLYVLEEVEQKPNEDGEIDEDAEVEYEWKIQHHHSSVMPEEIIAASQEDISEQGVKDLFHLWNDALATLDPKKVADRYAKTSVLLPTVSDIPRTDYDAIEDYFTNFLKLEPQGEILESNVVKGLNWAQDCGIYEFTMGATGAKVKGRYSFVYVFEDGEWKISHHHSSIMPEGIVSGEPITETEVRSLFNLWNDALATKDPEEVANRYSKSAVLLPTVSDVPRTDHPGIVDYFTNFLKLEPQGEILEGNIIVGTNWAQDAGVYEFTMGATGDKVKGRYTYVYVFEDGEWKISQHHSSVMPEAGKPQAITEEEVQGLFSLWNDALATEDPDAVAQRYAKKAVLLPTVSDVPRTDYDLIKDYFVQFLKKKPQGEILESNVTIGNNYCQDAGIYEFTMGATGDKVKGRYSFVYVYEDDEWKISHHHSSVMPEAILGASPPPAVEEEPEPEPVATLESKEKSETW